MSRAFAGKSFIDAYCKYADRGFVPPQFNLWSALSIVAGALERRVWLPWSSSFSFYPNIYVMLVSMPGDGKSVALNEAVDLLIEVNRRNPVLNIMPNQVTEAKFIELMGYGRSFTDTSTGKELLCFQNAGYYYASEASNALKNVFGDFIACLTDFYDCPKKWERATKKDGKPIRLQNVCMNLLAGSTFDYLGKLVNDENIMGGFASRIIYVVSQNKEVFAQRFQNAGDALTKSERDTFYEALVSDLTSISKMSGEMSAEPAFGAAWEKWYPEYEKKRRSLSSEKAQSLMARTNTNILKTAMLFSAAESDDRVLRLHHWQRAHDLIMGIQAETPKIFSYAKAHSSDQSHPNTRVNAVFAMLRQFPEANFNELTAKLTMKFGSLTQSRDCVQALINSGVLGTDGGAGPIRVIGNPDDYL